jgi:hypothetical protein
VPEGLGAARLDGDRLVQAIVLVSDLDSARRRTEALGLHVQEGGRHPGRGTANLIVAFGAHYLELLAVVDETEARSSPQGRPVVAALDRRGPGLARWSVEAADIDATAARVGLVVEKRHRLLPDATTIRWRSVGVDEAWEDPWRCAFMAWDDPDRHPARLGLDVHPNGATGFARLEVDVPDTASLRRWTGGAVPEGVVVSKGATSGPTALFLATPGGEIPVS